MTKSYNIHNGLGNLREGVSDHIGTQIMWTNAPFNIIWKLRF